MTPFQSLVNSLAVSGITEEAAIHEIAALRNVVVDTIKEVEAIIEKFIEPEAVAPVDAPVVEETK